LDHAKEVVVGIGQDDKIIVGEISPRIAGGPELDKPLHLALLIVAVKVEVQSAPLS